jgi:hypothetical protein
VTWRPWLEDRVLRQMQDLPSEAFDMLVRTLARICDDPYDLVFSVPVPPVPGRRVADLGDFGFIEFIADEATGLVRVYHLVWTGLAIPHRRSRRTRPALAMSYEGDEARRCYTPASARQRSPCSMPDYGDLGRCSGNHLREPPSRVSQAPWDISGHGFRRSSA